MSSGGKGRGLGTRWARPGNVRPSPAPGDADTANNDALRDFFFGTGPVTRSATATGATTHTGTADALHIRPATATGTVSHAGTATATRVPAGGATTRTATGSGTTAHEGSAQLPVVAVTAPICVEMVDRVLDFSAAAGRTTWLVAAERTLDFSRPYYPPILEDRVNDPAPIPVVKGPSEVLPFRIAFLNGLRAIGAGETIASTSWSVTPSGITVGSTSNTDEVATATLSGGTAGVSYLVTCAATTNNSRVLQQSLQVSVRNI